MHGRARGRPWPQFGYIWTLSNLPCRRLPSSPLQPATFEFYDPQSPIYTSPRVLPPATVRNCKVSDAIIAQGSSIQVRRLRN